MKSEFSFFLFMKEQKGIVVDFIWRVVETAGTKLQEI